MRSRESIEAEFGLTHGRIQDPVLEVLLDNRDLMQQLVRELGAHDREMKVLAATIQSTRSAPEHDKK
jgi:hypothetical protein